MLSPENLTEEIRILEDHFAERLAAHANKQELTTIFVQIKTLKQQSGITCHSQITEPYTTLPISFIA